MIVRFVAFRALSLKICWITAIGCAMSLGPVHHALAAPADPTSPATGDVTAPGGAGSAAGIAKKFGATAQPAGSPGTFDLANGVKLTATYIGEAAANPVGGVSQGAAYAGQVFLGLDFDLGTLADIPDGSIHFAMVQRHGESDSARFIGNDTSVQEIYGQQKLRLTIFTYQQKFMDGRLDLEVGRSAVNAAFLTSPLYCYFQSNVVCGSPVYVFKNSNLTAFPASGWAGHVKYYLSEKVFVHVGAYEVNPNNTAPPDTGFDWRNGKANGVSIPVEIGYETSFANDAMPRHYILGGWYDASRLADPYLDASGRPAILSGAAYKQNFGRSSIYGRFDQMIWRPDPTSERGLSVFGVALFNTSGRVQEDHSFELGLLQLGTFAGRDLDTIGFMVDERRFSSLFVDNILAARTLAGGSASIPREEVMFELNYGLQIGKAARLTPNLQYVLNPDQLSAPSRPTNIRNAFVVGGRLTLDLSTLASLR